MLLEDLVAQRFRNFEVIIVDGRSTDKTARIVSTFHTKDSRFTLKRCVERNVSTQRNLGAKHAKGQMLLFLDADARITSMFLIDLKNVLKQYPCDAWTVFARPDTSTMADTIFMSIQNYLFTLLSSIKKPFCWGACLGCSRIAFHTSNGFNHKINFMEDSEFVQALVKKNFTFRVFSKPVFTFSMRRYKKSGKLELIRRVLPHHLKAFFLEEYTIPKSAYPMRGGASYSQRRTKI